LHSKAGNRGNFYHRSKHDGYHEGLTFTIASAEEEGRG
jgi:hypothetical protein